MWTLLIKWVINSIVTKYNSYVLGHKWILIFNIWTFFNFQFQMFECLLTPTQWVFNSPINLCSDNFMIKTSNRYLPLLTYSNKVTFCIKFVHKLGINTINECLGAKNILTNVTYINKWTFECYNALLHTYVVIQINMVIKTFLLHKA